MRGLLAAILCLVPGVCAARMLPGAEPGGPPPSPTASARVATAAGRIGAVDTVGMSFVCAGAAGSRTYWVSRTTDFRVGQAQASFYDLKTGEPAEVVFHRSDGQNVADLVRIPDLTTAIAR